MKDIALYQHKFRLSLVGRWITIEGSFSLMSETFEFYSDGTGVWIQSSGSGDCKTYFDWKIEQPFVLQIRETNVVYDSDDSPDFEYEEDAWDEFGYEFKEIANDCGHEIALCNKDEEHFYFSDQRIGYAHPASIL